MKILGIETSCDETSIAVVSSGVRVHSCVIASSKHDFEKMGGVIPEDAARKQLEALLPSLTLALSEAQCAMHDLDAIAVTVAPGLLGSLLVGTSAARMLSRSFDLPLIPVHHTLGHLSSTWIHDQNVESIPSPSFPMLTLSVSGGHSDIWYRTSHLSGKKIGTTRDDAAGEAFDKGAVLLGLHYPGGPTLSRLAESGDPHAYTLPLPLLKEEGCDFSFSGLKTSLKYLLQKMTDEEKADATVRANVAASYESAICAHLLRQLEKALQMYPDTKEIHIVGGVSANRRLKSEATTSAHQHSLTLRTPSIIRYCTDNGAMIAAAGYFAFQEKGDVVFHEEWTTMAAKELALG
jgi:N6-L-threonylcarbamoyladenine synthase